MVLIGASTWILAHWLDYATLTLSGGTHVSSILGFWQYWQWATEHLSLRVSTSYNVTNGVSTGELGAWGYAQQIVQLLGFLAGGFATYAYLDGQEKCLDCRKYARSTALLSKVSPQIFDDTLASAQVVLPDLVTGAKAALGSKALVGLSLHKNVCPQCSKTWLRPSVIRQAGRSTDTVKLRVYSTEPGLLAGLETACLASAQPK
jgi:hypothetical protein